MKQLLSKRGVIFILTWGLFLGSILAGYSQEKVDSLSVVEMKDGSINTGKIISQDTALLILETKNGTLQLKQGEVKSNQLLPASRFRNGVYWPESPHTSRHFWGPSGYGLKKGEGYYQNIGIMFNQVSYGLTDNFTMGIGIAPTFLIGAPAEFTPIWLTPKITFPYKNGKGGFGVGAIYSGFLGELGNGFGVLYGVNTFGGRDKQVTVGIGYGYSSENGLGSSPSFSVSGLWRTSRKWSVVTENYYINSGSEGFGLISLGGRYSAKRLAIDAGGFIPLNLLFWDSPIILPWLGIAIPFK